jgi:hypothetical protein
MKRAADYAKRPLPEDAAASRKAARGFAESRHPHDRLEQRIAYVDSLARACSAKVRL